VFELRLTGQLAPAAIHDLLFGDQELIWLLA
jgi:hypothetical protein